MPLDVPDQFHRNCSRSREQGRARARESAEFSLRYLLDQLGWRDFADAEILDVGCGTKLTSALLDRAVGRYVGVDVHRRDGRLGCVTPSATRASSTTR